MIFRRTIVAETRRDSTGAFLLPTCPPSFSSSLFLTPARFHSRSLSFRSVSLPPPLPSVLLLLSCDFLPSLPMLCPSLIHVVASSFCLSMSLSFTPAVSIFLFLLCFLILSCSLLSLFLYRKLFLFSSHNFLLLSPFCSVLLSYIHLLLSYIHLFPSTMHSPLTHAVCLPLRLTLSFFRTNVKGAVQVMVYSPFLIYSPLLVHAHFTYSCSLLLIPYPSAVRRTR